MKKLLIATAVAASLSVPALAGDLKGFPSDHKIESENWGTMPDLVVQSDGTCLSPKSYDIKGYSLAMTKDEFIRTTVAYGGDSPEEDDLFLRNGYYLTYEFNDFTIGGQKVNSVTYSQQNLKLDTYGDGRTPWDCETSITFAFDEEIPIHLVDALSERFGQKPEWTEGRRLFYKSNQRGSLIVGHKHLKMSLIGRIWTTPQNTTDLSDF